MSTRRNDRRRKVLSLLRDRGPLSSAELCAALRVSAATLRRDLSDLQEQGLLLRSHGGASATGPPDGEIPVRLRDHRLLAVKQSIARHAAALVPPGPQSVALTGGVTTAEVARALRGRRELTIVTNSLTIAADCAGDAHTRVIMIGGRVRASTLEVVGPLSERALHAITVGTAIVGADGMSAESGATTYDESEARTATAMASGAQRVVVAVDGSKIGKVTRATMLPVGDVGHLVTDGGADRGQLRAMAAAGIVVHVVGPG